MKRHFNLLASVLLVIAMVFALASCGLIDKIIPGNDQPEHEHAYVDGVCDCGETDPNYVAPHTHNFVEGKCECGETDPNYTKPECAEHAYGAPEVTKEATCTEAGSKTLTCTVCGYATELEIAPNGHTEEDIPGNAATCTEAGLSTGSQCTVCGVVTEEQIAINPKGHSFVEGACTVCGVADPEYNGPKTYSFHFSDVVVGADKDAIAAGTTYADGYFTIVGTVTQRVKDGAVYCVEVAKNGTGAIQFIVTGTATVEVQFSSTGGSNTSKIGIFDADGNLVANNEGITEVTGASAGMTVVTYNLTAGTYTVVSPASNVDAGETDYNRGARVYYVNVTETPAEEVEVPEIKVETTDTYGWFDEYSFTADAEGYYTFTLPAGLGFCSKAQYDNYDAPELDFQLSPEGGDVVVGLEAGETLVFYVGAITKDNWTITWSFEAGEVEDAGQGGDVSGVTELVVGSNDVVFADGELSSGKEFSFTVTEEGTYTFRGDLMAAVMDAEGNSIGRGQVYLTPGTYTVALFSMMPMPSNSFVINITFEAPATGEPDGSEQFPYIWETIPESVTFESDNINMVYYVFTATADGSVTFTWAVEGNDWFNYFELVDGATTENNGSGFAKTSHTFVVEAGKTYRVGLGTWNEGGETVVSIAFNACAHVWSEATCTAPSTCANCGATTGDKAEHTSTVAEPTCANPDVCGVCGVELSYVDHAWDDGVVITPADCSTGTDGVKLLTCTVCGATEEETIWAYHEWDYSQCVEATCTEDGNYHAVCTVCGTVDSYVIKAEGHYNWYATCGDTTNCMECGVEFTVEHDLFPADCFSPAMCSICWQTFGEPLPHNFVDGVCTECYMPAPHEHDWSDPTCTEPAKCECGETQGEALGHDYVYGICSVCQAKDPAYVDYYLVGYINGADYGCEGDHANLGEYKFVDGKLIVSFKSDSYVFIKSGNLNGESVKWYLFETYHDASMNEGTLFDSKSEKMFIPGGVEIIFTLTVNEDGTLTLSYHAHSYQAVVTDPTCTKKGYTTHTCSCGASYTDSEVDVIPHADANGDYKCDACSTKMLPADGTALTIPQALAVAKVAGTSYSTQKYYITGIVTGLYNTTYGNFYIKDAEGNEICIYGLYSYDGSTRYDAMSYKPVNGDEVTVYTVLGMYSSTCQGKSAWLDEVVAHEHNYTSVVTAPTCLYGGYTTHTCSICAGSYVDTQVDALGHTTENGTCERCNATVGGDAPAEPVTVSKSVKDLITQYGWTTSTTKQSFNLDDVVSVKINGGSNTGKAYNGDHIRIYATDSPAGTMTITVPEGYELVSIKVSAQTGTYAFFNIDGVSGDVCNKTVEVSGNSVVLKSVKNGSDGKQVRVTNIEVVYKPVG